MKKTGAAVLAVGVLIIGVIAYKQRYTAIPDHTAFPKKPAEKNQWMVDRAGLLSDSSIDRINTLLTLFHRETDIEFRALCMSDLDSNGIDQWTNRLFKYWEVGSLTKGMKGLLFVLAENERLVRLEVGYDLEGIYTDGIVGYIENEQMKPFFENGAVARGFEAALEFIVAEAWNNIKSGEYIPDKSEKDTDNWSGGGGAKKNIVVGSSPGTPKRSVSDADAHYYAAQSTPQQTFKRYLYAAVNRIKDPDLGIYTSATRDFFRNRVVTNAQQDAVRKFVGVTFSLETDGDRAVVYFPDRDLTYNPFFLRRNEDGWQLDFVTMSDVIRFNHRNHWHFVSRYHPYIFAFEKYRIDSNGFVRFDASREKRGYLYIVIKPQDDSLKVAKVLPGSEAAQKGIRPGDRIIHVNDKKVAAVGWKKALREMKGEPGGTVSLVVYRPQTDTTFSATLTLQEKFQYY
ncbi:MAG: TPM domain-containing protein [Chitinispirillaceae bacterium]|nr:TPM domain-containing protein [Chitinispirillaceae bacterium]